MRYRVQPHVYTVDKTRFINRREQGWPRYRTKLGGSCGQERAATPTAERWRCYENVYSRNKPESATELILR